MPEWISVNDELPKEYETCLLRVVHTSSPDDGFTDHLLGRFFDGRWEVNYFWPLKNCYSVTHWMKIPELMKAKREGEKSVGIEMKECSFCGKDLNVITEAEVIS